MKGDVTADRHRTCGGDAMDALASRTILSCGRTAPRRTAKSCGPDTPTLVSSEQNDLFATGARKPGPRGEHEGNR